ncbi:hypothetical protein QYM36_007568 [Artemia franciscana]|uniref:Uncharacterized protein n=1 Tax=Artemia franciscana TaxID=6661 RepID=A0AA88IU45_ARTSF|nr:hypothetical protein QYM36_007568 [Artemia franciscana]
MSELTINITTKEKAAKKEIVASDSEDSDFIEPKTKKSKSTVTQAKKIQDVNETDLKKEKLKSNDSEEEKSATKKKKSEEEKINGKAHKRKETESEDSDSENEEPASKPAMKPVNHTKRQMLEKKQIDLKGIDSEDSHEVRTKKSQTKKLMVSAKAYENDAEPNLKVTTSTPKSTVSLARKIPPELDSSDETDEETDDVKSSTGKPGNGERNIQSVKLQRNKDSSSESEEDGSEQLNKEPAKKKDESADSDNTTPSPLPVKSTKNARDNLKKKVQKGQKTYLSVSEMKRLEYNELIDALKKAVPGFPVRSSLGALDVFMEIYPITRDLQNARKKFKRLEPKEQEEIISMYRQEQHDYEKRIKQFFGGFFVFIMYI